MTPDEIRGRATITIEEAGRLLGVSRATAYRAAEDGTLPVLKLSPRKHLVPVARLLDLLGEHVSPAGDAPDGREAAGEGS